MAYAEDIVLYANNKEMGYWDSNSKRFKLWDKKDHTRTWKIDYLYTVCENNRALYTCLSLIMQSIDKDNVIRFWDNNRLNPCSPDEDLRKTLDLGKTQFYEMKKLLFDKGMIIETVIKGKSFNYKRFYLNPIYSLGGNGISITCYSLFREYLSTVLTNRQITLLEKHYEEENIASMQN